MMSGKERRKSERRSATTRTVTEERRRNQRRTTQRRTDARIPLELWMEEVSDEGDVYFRRTGNVSSGGVYFDRSIPHPVGTELTLKFAIPGDKEMVVARGEVVSTRNGTNELGMGVKFRKFEGNGQSRMRDFLRNA